MTSKDIWLTRRDALAALTASGISLGVGIAIHRMGGKAHDQSSTTIDRDLDTLSAVATVVYPSQVTGIQEFVETYTIGRIRNRPGYADGLTDALSTLDEYTVDKYGSRFSALQSEEQDKLLREIGVDTSHPNPEGNDVERVRYYLVNELLYALYTSPVGGKLVGIENPQGHPGGLDSYQQGFST